MGIRKLYHGSDRIITAPMYAYGDSKRDFGAGFYCTEYENMGREWASSHVRAGFLNIYEINTEYLYILDLSSKEHSVLEWVALILENRCFRITDARAETLRAKIIEQQLPDIMPYDAIIGMRADDSHFSLVRSFLSGNISEEQLRDILDMQPDQNQIFFKNPKCFRLLEYVGSEVVGDNEYYNRGRRDEVFRDWLLNNNIYTEPARNNLGELIEYVAEACHDDVDEFMRMMEVTGFLEAWDASDGRLLYGSSGTETAMRVYGKSGAGNKDFPQPLVRMVSGVSDWCGRMLQYLSDSSGIKLRDIVAAITYEKLCSYYPQMHLWHAEQTADRLREQIFSEDMPTSLQQLRRERGLSQKQLSVMSGVNLRTLQQYEIRAKDIRRAAADKVIRLADALGVSADRLLQQ